MDCWNKFHRDPRLAQQVGRLAVLTLRLGKFTNDELNQFLFDVLTTQKLQVHAQTDINNCFVGEWGTTGPKYPNMLSNNVSLELGGPKKENNKQNN